MVIDTAATPTAAPAEHEYDVNPDGTVRDWRDVVKDRAEASPDDETQDTIITAEVHCCNGLGQVGDPVIVGGRRGTIEQFLFRPSREGKRKKQAGGWDAVVRFEDGAEPQERRVDVATLDLVLDEITRVTKPPVSEQTTHYGVPTDASFGDDEVKPAPDLLQLAVKLIETTEDFPWAKTLTQRIAFFWKKKGGATGGQPRLYAVRFANAEEKRANGWRVVIRFMADTCRTLMLKPDVIEAMVHESLCQIERDEHGNLRKLAPDFRGYGLNVNRFGALVPPVRQAADALALEIEDVRNLRLDLDAEDDDGEIETGV